ncbi:MAG: hypothetical protein ACLTQI_01445 [Slackia sp.]
MLPFYGALRVYGASLPHEEKGLDGNTLRTVLTRALGGRQRAHRQTSN